MFYDSDKAADMYADFHFSQRGKHLDWFLYLQSMSFMSGKINVYCCFPSVKIMLPIHSCYLPACLYVTVMRCMWLYVLPVFVLRTALMLLPFCACTSCTLSVLAIIIFYCSLLSSLLYLPVFPPSFLINVLWCISFLGCLLLSGRGQHLEIAMSAIAAPVTVLWQLVIGDCPRYYKQTKLTKVNEKI